MEAVAVNIEELEKYSLLRGLNLGQAEKDYYQNMILFMLYNKFSRELVFKGGTALAKCYGLNRFSEDLDFNLSKETNFMEILKEGLDNFGINYKLKPAKSRTSEKHKIKIQGPLYKGSEKTLCSVTLDVSFREKVFLEPNTITIARHMDIIPAFEVYVLKEEEIFAEKIRAIMTRESARDLYDLVFLLNKGVSAKKALIETKLDLVDLKFEKNKFLKNCSSLNLIWDSELRSLVKHVPDFKESFEVVKSWADKFPRE